MTRAERMDKAFEKIIDKLREVPTEYRHDEYNQAIYDVINFISKVAIDYNNGWIACSESLPEDDSICIVTVEYPNNETMVDYGWFDRKRVCWFVGMQEFRTSNILAWQPLPEPYKEID